MAAKKMTETQEAELTIQQKYENTPNSKASESCSYKGVLYSDAGNGKFKYSFSEGNDLKVKENLDPDKDAKVISTTGKKFRYVTLPGKYVNRMKIVDTIATEDFLEDEEDIKAEYSKYLLTQREKAKKAMVDNPDATMELLAEAFKNISTKATKATKEAPTA